MLNANFNILGALITLFGGLSYLQDTVRGNIQPNRVSWFLWALAPFIAFSAQINQGVGLQSLLTLSLGLIPAMVFIGSFVNKKSYWKLERLDIVCGILSLVGLILWTITRIGNIAIIFSILSDGLASFPTLVKAYKQPESENSHVFLANAVSGIITLLTITHWNFQNFGFPLYVVLMMGSIGVFIQCKVGRIFHKK